jgi:hypothetical protein
MLETTGAPPQWHNSDAHKRFAASITFRWPAPTKRQANLYNRTRELIDRLQGVLPMVIADMEGQLKALDNPPPEFQQRATARARSAVMREVHQLKRLLAALPELAWERSPSRDRRQLQIDYWHTDAARLYALYKRHVDPKSGKSADGPAVRFVEAALRRMGYQHLPSRSAIAKELQRWEQEVADAKRQRRTKRP